MTQKRKSSLKSKGKRTTKSKSSPGTSPKKHSGKIPFIQDNWRVLLISVLALAAIVRFGHIYQVYSGPLNNFHMADQSDSRFFHDWAMQIKGGDILTNRALHPMHNWHEVTAEIHFQKEGFKNTADGPGNAKELWDDWYGGKRFHQEPFYPYLLAIIYSIFGPAPYLIFLLQVIISLGSLLLLIKITEKPFGKEVAIIAALIFALYGPAVFYDGVLLRASLITFFSLALVFSTENLISKPDLKGAATWGAVAGISLLLKFSFILLIAALLIHAFFRLGKVQKSNLKIWGTLAGTFLLCLTPLVIRNLAVGAPVLSSSSVGAITFLNSNVSSSEPHKGFKVDNSKSEEIMSETDGKFIPTVFKTLQTNRFGQLINLSLKKLATIFNHYEIPNNTNFYFYKSQSIFLSIAFFRYAFVVALGLLGFVLAWKEKGLQSLHLAILFNIVVLLLFYVISRFKLPLAVLFIPYTSFAIFKIFGWIRSRELSKSTWLLIPAIASFFLLRSISPERVNIRSIDIGHPFTKYSVLKLDEAADQNDFETIMAIYKQYSEMMPEVMKTFSQTNPPVTNREIELTRFYASHFEAAADILEGFNKIQEANEARILGVQLRGALNAAGG